MVAGAGGDRFGVGPAGVIRSIYCLGTVDERMLILIDIEKLMTSRDMQLMDEVAVA